MKSNDEVCTITADELAESANAALAALASLDRTLPDRLPAYLAQHSRWPDGWSYGRVPEPVSSTISDIRAQGGQSLVAAFHRSAICIALRETRKATEAHSRWHSSLPYFDDAAGRVLRALPTKSDDELDYPHDSFAKDIALATGRVWHAKAQLVEPRLGIGRRRLLRSGAGTIARAAGLLARLGGNSPFYEIHTYNHLLHWFTEDGWADCYRIIAETLARDPVAKGVFGTAWFFDPGLGQVSPRLGYLHRFPAERGGIFLKVSNTPSGISSAIAKSETRRQLYEQGQYSPQEYLLVWPRDAMIGWLRSGGS